MSRPTIYTIGHSTHPIENFITLLRQHGIVTLVDVRSVPYSRFNPQYRKRAIAASLDDTGIGYVYLGEALGGRPGESRGFTLGDIADYSQIAEQPWYLEGLDELIDIARSSRCAIMCSEENPETCHRNLLVGQSLMARSLADVVHIRGDGDVEHGQRRPQQQQLF